MKKDRYLLHIVLFLLSVVTTLMAGAEHVTGKLWIARFFEGMPRDAILTPGDLLEGWEFSFGFIVFLTFHEFGHYFTAVYHKVKCSLPFYIPLFIPIFPMNIGSMGAVIRIREIPPSTKKFFDIGIAGPLAGFVVSICLLWFGFTHLPDKETYIYNIHPEYVEQFGGIPTEAEVSASTGGAYAIGTSLLFEFFKHVVADDPAQVPPDFELMHYPWLFVGFLTLFFTALNLLPIGQLDGGHVIYGLLGVKRSRIISRVAVIALVLFGGIGLMDFDFPSGPLLIFTDRIIGDLFEVLFFRLLYLGFLYLIFRRLFQQLKRLHHWLMVGGMVLIQIVINLVFPGMETVHLWLLYAFLVSVVLGVDHPRAQIEQPLDTPRKILGWVAVLIFILSFSPNPILII